MKMTGSSFHIVDVIIFVAVLLLSLAIGLYQALTGGRQQTHSEFFLGNGRLRTFPVSLSIMVSFVSAILVVGTPAETYNYGTSLFFRNFGYCLAILLSSLVLVPVFYKLKVTSAFELLELRYESKIPRLFGTLAMIVGSTFYMGLVMYTPSTALEAVTGLPLWINLICCGAVAIIYTSLGGMRAVVWTDTLQAVVMILGMLAITIQGCIKVGGVDKVWKINLEGNRLQTFQFDLDPRIRLSFWSLIFGAMFSGLTNFGIGQSMVQRFCSLPSLSQARRSLYMNIPFLLIINVLATASGLTIYAYYADRQCDPVKAGYITSSNQLTPYFVKDALSFPGVMGLFIATLYSGALSSMSSLLNSLSAVTWQDILQPHFTYLNQSRQMLISKGLVVIFGAAAIGISYLAENLGGHVLYASLSLTGVTSGPTLGLYLLGLFFPQANSKGALVGAFTASAFLLWLAIGSFIVKPHTRVRLPTSISGCLATNISSAGQVFLNASQIYDLSDHNATTESYQKLLSTSSSEMSGFDRPLSGFYEISFLWYGAIGCLLTVLIGFISSVIFSACLGWDTNSEGQQYTYFALRKSLPSDLEVADKYTYEMQQQEEVHCLNNSKQP